MFDALRNRRERHDELIHHETRIHSGTHERDASCFRRCIELGRQLRISAIGIRKLFARRHDGGFGFETGE